MYQPNANLVVSPFSLSFAMGMLLAGTGGSTKLQLAKVLLDLDEKKLSDEQVLSEQLDEEFGRIFSEVVRANLAVLRNANMLYAQKE